MPKGLQGFKKGNQFGKKNKENMKRLWQDLDYREKVKKRNKIIIDQTCCRIELYKGRTDKVIGYAIIDKEDIDKVKDIRWRLNKRGYVGNVETELHRFIMGKKKGFEIDHVNRCKLDNRKSNLRFVTRAGNMWNTEHNGYYKQKETGNWVVQIKCNGKRYCIGSFKTEKQAKEARQLAETKYYGKK